jgi:predicted Zn-dependent protease
MNLSGFVGLMVVCTLSSSMFAAERIVPVVPPGYVPSLDRDEQGIWMELSEIERRIAASPLRIRDSAVNRYVERVACQVAGDYCPDIRVYVIRNPHFNASMAANGMMQVWTGLLMRTTSEDELASVLGHEVAHYAMGHTLARFRRIKSSSGIGSVFSLVLGMATGVLVPLGEMMAIADALAFSRAQETEADLFGAQLMADSGFDPRASYHVWENLMAEEAVAAEKREAPGFFMKTHPDADKRIVNLRDWVSATFEDSGAVGVSDQGLIALGSEYQLFMEDQVDTNRYGRTGFLLDLHAEIGIDLSVVNFFRGEMYRQRGEEGDGDRALQAYQAAIEGENAPPEAFRNAGYLLLKKKQLANAQAMFSQYLTREPNATDRDMIEFYMEE